MTGRMIWRAAGLDSRFLGLSALVLISAPILQVVPQVVVDLGRSEWMNLPMIVLIGTIYELAGAVLALPHSFPFGLAAWLIVHFLLTAMMFRSPWPGRLAGLAMGFGLCVGRFLYWDMWVADAVDRTLEIALGVIPASALMSWAVYPLPPVSASGGTE